MFHRRVSQRVRGRFHQHKILNKNCQMNGPRFVLARHALAKSRLSQTHARLVVSTVGRAETDTTVLFWPFIQPEGASGWTHTSCGRDRCLFCVRQHISRTVSVSTQPTPAVQLGLRHIEAPQGAKR